MKRKFLTSLSILLFLNLTVKTFWILGIDRSVQNLLGTESFGFYFNILNFSFLLNIILDFGITNYNNRNIAQHVHLLRKHFSGIVILRLLLGVLYMLVIMIIGLIIGYSKSQLAMLSVIGVNQFLLAFILYLRSNISGLLLFKTDSFLSVLDRLLMIIMVGAMLLIDSMRVQFKIEWFVYAQTLAYVLTAIVALGLVIYKSGFRRPSWSIPFFLMIMKQSWPYALLALLMASYNRVDTVFIERLLPKSEGLHQVGIYAEAFRMLDAASMVAYLFAVLLLPLFANMIKNRMDVSEIVKLSYTLIFVFSVSVAVISVFYSSPIMSTLYPIHPSESLLMFQERIVQSARIFSLLMMGFVAISTTYIFGTLLTANGSIRILNYTALGGVLVSFLLNYFLIPEYKAFGSAIASLSSQALTALAQMILVLWIFKMKKDWVYIFRMSAFVIGGILAGVIIQKIELNWFHGLIILAAFMFIWSILLRLLSLKALMAILNEGK
ncbi:MAG: oligosaccharide flippase family protein [Bacteroidales bacterium]|jgi:O-antigen/teichoic acid export membrane protein|nr:oligosaccharide flippase family protein [Bacteroidales bacterium]